MESEELIELMGKVEEKGIPWDKVEAEIGNFIFDGAHA